MSLTMAIYGHHGHDSRSGHPAPIGPQSMSVSAWWCALMIMITHSLVGLDYGLMVMAWTAIPWSMGTRMCSE